MNKQTITPEEQYQQDFLKLSNLEYEALSTYCNSISSLSSSLSSQNTSSGNTKDQLIVNRLDLIFDMNGHSRPQHLSALGHYDTALEKVRFAHSKLISHFEARRDLFADEMVKEHMDISGRVIKTCATSSSSKGFGPLHENGLMKDIAGSGEENWQEVRVVSLVALRASISRVKRVIGR